MENNNENKIIFDININSIKDLYSIILNKWYDFVTLEANDSYSSVKFRKEWKIVEEKFIKLTVYLEIIVKAKTISWLDVWVTNEEQEWTWEVEINSKKYKSLAKVVPWNNWEKLFLKLKVIEQQNNIKKEAKPIELWKLIWFFWAVLVVMLIVWWSFLAFIVLNAKTIEDVKFFLALWINLNEINSFISRIVWIFFSLLTLILTIFLIIFLFKFLLTKKIFRKKKATAGILSLLFFILTFSSAFSWMVIDRKVKDLPKWDIMALWDVQLFDNKIYKSKFIEEKFKWWKVNDSIKKSYSNIWELKAKNLIWPIEILFDVEQLAKKESWWNIKNIESYIWNIWWEEVETKLPTLIKNFEKKWNYDVKIKFLFSDWTVREFDNRKAQVPSIWITWIVDIKEKTLNSWWKLFTFNATSLKELWWFKWYDLEKNWDFSSSNSIYITKAIFNESAVELVVWEWENEISKIFVVNWDEESEIYWEINFEKSLANDREYTFSVKNIKANQWIWFIEKYIWKIDSKTYTREWDFEAQEKSSEVTHSFLNYNNYEVSVELISSSWASKKITKNIDIKKSLKIKEWLTFKSWNEILEDFKHNKNIWEYRLKELWIPTKLEIDSRYVRADDESYILDKVSWDYNSDWTIDEESKIWKVEINQTWWKKITVNYTFKNIRDNKEEILVKEIILLEAVKKDYNIVFKIKQNSEYAPTIIWFDASQSSVNNANISKFIWDFGDWIREEGDAIIEWHRYLKDWEYNVTLIIVTSDWKKYSTNKNIILKPRAEKVKIKSSLKEAPIYQWIDFSSSESVWDIIWYFWDFWDGNTSTEANPTHMYDKPWKYKVKLTADFRNRNIKEDVIDIIITN